MEKRAKNPWYFRWWGVLLAILFFPFVVPYLVWTKTHLHKWVKVGIIALCLITFFVSVITSTIQKSQAPDFVAKAEACIAENNIPGAVAAIESSKEMDYRSDTNPAFSLSEKVDSLQSEDFLKSTLLGMSDADFDLLQKGELNTVYIQHERLNSLFIEKLKSNADKRAGYLLEKAAAEAKAAAEKRASGISSQFNPWDGSHINLTYWIKDKMNDPKSYEHVETKYIDKGDYLIVSTTFRGTNGFGGVVKNTVAAKISLDGQVLEILGQE